MSIEEEYKDFTEMLDGYQKKELTKVEKKNLEAFDKDIADKLVDEVLTSLTKRMLLWSVSSEFVNWAQFALHKFSKYFKN